MRISLFLFIVLTFSCFGQDVLVIDQDESDFGMTEADEFTVYESSDDDLQLEEFIQQKANLKGKSLSENPSAFDFSTSSLFIHFVLKSCTFWV